MARCNWPVRRCGALPRDPDEAVRVLREAIDAGVNHIDTSDYYGLHVTNQIIKQALHPYPDDLVIVTKVGARRGANKSWIHALSRQELIDAVHDNLRNLGVDKLDVVNLRVGDVTKPSEGSIEEPLTVLWEGLLRCSRRSSGPPARPCALLRCSSHWCGYFSAPLTFC